MTVRSDAVRSRKLILNAARTHDANELRLNDVAREAGVGVGTIYRHFPTVHALIEALSLDALQRLRDIVQTAAAETDEATALKVLLQAAVDLQLEDSGLQTVLVSSSENESETGLLKREIFATLESIVEKAKASGTIRTDMTVERLQHLVCGVEHAIRLGTPDDREIFLDVLLRGLGAQRTS